jgi:hypothetical protein
VAIGLVFVPMAFAIVSGVVTVSLWEELSWITLAIPALALVVAAAPFKLKSNWAWRIPLIAGMVAIFSAAGMTVQLFF